MSAEEGRETLLVLHSVTIRTDSFGFSFIKTTIIEEK